jgi:ribosomal protein L37E
MLFHTEIKGTRRTQEFLECKHCNKQMFSEQELCTHCGSDDLKWMTQYTVYQVVYAETPDDAFDTAFDIGNWKATGGEILIKETER